MWCSAPELRRHIKNILKARGTCHINSLLSRTFLPDMETKETKPKIRSDITPETQELQLERKRRLAEALRKNLRRRKKDEPPTQTNKQ